ncbi:molybdopterin converting factor subunit 1 [Gracilibacillus oryzae]|uniref:Molybdopterin synthase sulfur carrier subunit n=1 Tax=Gracilibacillus oryzae TaxID=1672701 RepID=A0A7C8KTA7_9BACI|nr:molybdopterin converting factor subunit 1 [Gracilibacillus oryzae]KAB8131797.1 molybdopterin converting factor subunit 1 [Gracilibacillus oryzae]
MINILLFAQMQEEVGKEKIAVEMEKTTVKELKEYLQMHYKLTQLNESMVAVNEAYALENDEVKTGDTVAIIPPVSGG